MSELKGAAIFGQSGGPTSVINASAALVTGFLHILAYLVAGIHRIVSAVVEEIADIILFEYFEEPFVIRIVFFSALELVTYGAECG